MNPPQVKESRRCRKGMKCRAIAIGLVVASLIGISVHHHKLRHSNHASHWSPYGFGGIEAPALDEECVSTFKSLCPETPVGPGETSVAPQLEFFKCAFRVAGNVQENTSVLTDDCRAQMQGALSDLGLAVEKPAVVSILSRAEVVMHCHHDLPRFCSDLVPSHHHYHDDDFEDFDPMSPTLTYKVGKCLIDNKESLSPRCEKKISMFEDQLSLGEDEFVRMANSYTWSWYSLSSRDSDFLYALLTFTLFSFGFYMVVMFMIARFVLRFVFAAFCKRQDRFIPVAPVAGGYVRLDGENQQNTATWVPIITTDNGAQQEKPANQQAFLQV